MIKKKLDDSKVLLVFVCEDKTDAEKQIDLVKKTNPTLPPDFQCFVHTIIGKKNLAASFNDVQKKSDARYKIYFTSPLTYLHKSLIMQTTEAFFLEPGTGMVGIMGSEMPLDGDYTQAKNFYGMYNYTLEKDQVQQYTGKEPLYYQSVHMLEGSFFATNEDIQWDEKIGDEFALAAQCCNFRAKGHDVGVFYQDRPLLIFEKNEFTYKQKNNAEDYHKQREKFVDLYRKKIQPLVSILIPTYNQPKFCQEALDSALEQTYKNIEILIGDDSTNEDTKKIIRPYLKKYPNVKYFYHNGKIPRGGGANMNFLLNKCEGEYVNYLLHDDLFHKEKIYKMMQYYIVDFEDRVGLVTSARASIDENKNYIGRQNPWQPRSDTVVKGEDVGRRLLFIIANFIGELTTVLFRKKEILPKNLSITQSPYIIGNFCGVSSFSYGDMDTWLEILKKNKDMVFMSETLSAFRKHAAQNTYNPNTRITLPLDALNFIMLAWLNDAFFRNVDELYYCLDKWPILADRWFRPVAENDPEIIKKRKEWIVKIREIFLSGNREKMIDCALSYLLENNLWNWRVMPLIRKNPYTGLLEKNVRDICFEIKGLDSVENNIWQAWGGYFSTSNKNAKFKKALQLHGFDYINTFLTFGGADFSVEFWGFMDARTNIWGSFFYSREAIPAGGNNIFTVNRYADANTLSINATDEEGASMLGALNCQIPSANPIGKLHHYELNYSHDTSTLRLFFDGHLVFSHENVVIERIKRWICLGNANMNNINYPMIGEISEFRLSDGICRHDSDFTLPTKPYELDEYTISLLHFDKKLNSR